MGIIADVKTLEPGSIVEMFEIDLQHIDNTIFRFHPGTNQVISDVVWQGNSYVAFPCHAEGFEVSNSGSLPRPKFIVANVGAVMSNIIKTYDDFLGVKITRRRTLLKYLDAVNFPGGVNPDADPSQEFMPDVWYVDRRVSETKHIIEFELAAAWDIEGVQLPRRRVLANTCAWKYRGAECGYAGPPVADIKDIPTSDPAFDQCGKRLSSCRLRFNGAQVILPFGAFPGVGNF